MTPGQPHLLTGGVEGYGEAREDAVVRAERAMRVIRQEEGCLGVNEGGRGTVAHRHALGLARRTGSKDDPGGVFGARFLEGRGAATVLFVERGAHPTFPQHAETFVGEDAVDVSLAEDHLGAFIGVVGVDGYVGRAGGERGQDGQVELALAGGHADADAVPAPHTAGVEFGGPGGDVGKQLGVGQDLAVIQGGSLWIVFCCGAHDVPQSARGGGLGA